MFEDTINNVMRTKDSFSSSVRDSFGASIVEDVLEPLEKEERLLHDGYSLAEAKMAQIRIMTAELRLIL